MTVSVLQQFDILCFSHLRWAFVYQRPQHLLTRFAKHSRVFFIEEPIYDCETEHYTLEQQPKTNVWVFTPHLTKNSDPTAAQQQMLRKLIRSMRIKQTIAWYYSPMSLNFSNDLNPSIVVYDCMDELSAFRFAPPALKQYESMLFNKADVVFTGGASSL